MKQPHGFSIRRSSRSGSDEPIKTGWWLNHHSEKYESQSEGLSHILWKIKNVPNHQPVYIYIYVHFGSIRCIWCMYNIYIYIYIYIYTYIYTYLYIYIYIYIISINYGIAMNSPYSLRLTTFHRPQGARSEIITPDLPLVAPLAKSARKPTYPALAPWNLIPTWSCIPGSQAWFKWLCRVIS